MSKTSRTLAALAAAAIALVVAGWIDSTFARHAESRANAAGDVYGFATVEVFGSLLIAGSVLLMGVLAWRAASVVVGLAYVVVGGFLVALPWLFWNFALRTAPAVLPEAVALALRNLFYLTVGGSDNGYFLNGGPLNAVETIGAAMLIGGVAALARSWRGRVVPVDHDEVVIPTADPMLP
jgi:hypothetical protein